jgi:hypothetical protein
MLLATLFAAVTLGQTQAPPAPVIQPIADPVQPTAASELTPAQQARLAQQRRHNGATVCENRAPTGSVMSRRMCSTERRAAADRTRARTYVGEVTRGSVHQPHPDVGGQ